MRAAVALALLAGWGCGLRLAKPPSGPGTPYPEYVAAYGEATQFCRGARTIVAVLSLSGRAGGTRLRGNVEAGLAAPGQARLEAPGPFGSRPLFILIARGPSATLLLPRDRRVIQGAAPEAIVEALAGFPLDADQLRGALTGCGLSSVEVSAGRTFPGDWLAIDAGEATHWLRRVQGSWRMVASSADGLQIQYSDFASGRPSTIRLRRTRGSALSAELTIKLSQVDINTDLAPGAFDLEIPGDALPMTVEELRRAGPLGRAERRSTP